MFVPTKVIQSTESYSFGNDDRLPNKLMAWVLESGVAKKAQQKRAVYISADGFADENAAILKVNPDQTADQLLNEISGYQSYFDGFALHIKRNGNSEIAEIKCLPFQDIRKRVDGSFIYNPTLSSVTYKKGEDVIIQAFKGVRKLTPDEMASILEHGEIYYAYTPTADSPHYPVPDYYAGIEDVRSSSELQKFDYETVINGFVTSGMLTIIGDLDTETKDSSGRTEYDYFTENLEQFTGSAKDSNGVSGRNKLMVVTARTKEEAPVLQQLDAKAIFDSSNTKRELVERAVCRLFGVNPVLVGYADAAVLGNQQALANASNELNNDVNGDQSLITRAFTQLLPDHDWTITSFRPIQYVPDSLLNELTPSEKRALIGYAPLENAEGSQDKLLTERLGVGGTQSLVAILSDVNLSDEQKRASLKILFGLSDADVLSLVPQVIEQPTTETITPEQITNYFANNFYEARVVTKADIASRYGEYFDAVNMTYSEYERWTESPCSKAIGGSRLIISRNLELLNINKSDWTEKHYRWAGQSIAAINRLRENIDSESPDIKDADGKVCGTKVVVSLKNWAHNPNKA